MTIVQEILSKDGILTSLVYEDVKNVRKIHDIMVSFKDGSKQCSIKFPNETKLLQAMNIIRSATGVVVLPLEEYFMVPIIKDDVVPTLVHKTISKHLYMCVKHILEQELLEPHMLLKRDAFKHMGIEAIKKIADNNISELEVNENILKIWSKTLYTPKEDLRLGVTPLQFYKTIIKNEKRVRIISSAVVS